MNIGATSIFDQMYLDDDDSQDTSDDDDTSMDDPMDNSEDDFDPMELDDDTNEALVRSTQVRFLMCTLEIPQKLQYKFLLLTFCYLNF